VGHQHGQVATSLTGGAGFQGKSQSVVSGVYESIAAEVSSRNSNWACKMRKVSGKHKFGGKENRRYPAGELLVALVRI